MRVMTSMLGVWEGRLVIIGQLSLAVLKGVFHVSPVGFDNIAIMIGVSPVQIQRHSQIKQGVVYNRLLVRMLRC